MDIGGFGVGLFRLGVDGIEKRSESNYRIGEIDESRLGLCLGYGRLISGYDLGATLSLEHHSIDDQSATSSPGLSLSAGRRLKPDSRWISDVRISVNGRNLVKPGIKLADETIRQPHSFDAGVSLGLLPKQGWNHMVSLSGSITKVDLIDPQMALGLEYGIDERIYVRGGVRDGDVSFGVGLSYRSIDFDYALVDRDLGELHMFSIKADIGMAISEKRKLRTERREADFNRLINTRLTDQSQAMVSSLVARGRQLLEEGELEQASIALDRAMFVASGSGMDTTEVHDLAAVTRAKLETARRLRAFGGHMDSARARLAAGDYLGARYQADLALAEIPGSQEAKELLDRADAMIERSLTHDRMVESRLRMADSLVSYGKYDQALVSLRTLSQVAGADERVRQTNRKAEFGHWQVTAEAAFARADYDRAAASLDSALTRFPEHPWCINLRSRIEQEADQVDAVYKTGQELFEQGNLPKAVERWEEVERLAPDYLSVREYLVTAYKFLGVELYTQSKLEEAVGVWKKAVRLAPDSTEIASYIKRTEAEIARLEELSYDYR
jgi:tetratricopeptide (TPR) repeat protein